MEEDTIQANGNVPMKSSHSENCFGSTDSEDDEFSDPVETEDFSGVRIRINDSNNIVRSHKTIKQ